MGLASKLGTSGSTPSAPSAPPMTGGGFPGAGQQGAPGGVGGPPLGYPKIGGQPQVQGRPGHPQGGPNAVQSGAYGASQPGQYGAPSSSGAPGQYGAASGPGSQVYPQLGGVRPQQPGVQGQYGAPQGFGGPQGQFGQQQGQFGQQQGQFGTPQQFGQQAQGYGQNQGFGQPQGYGQSQNQQFGQPQGQQFGAPQFAGQQGGGGGAFSSHMILQKLQRLVADNRLQAFYPPQKLEQVANFVASRDVNGLGQRWKLPREVTMDLVGLALYDICIYVDDSGSMAFEEGGERIDDMKAVLGRTADAATLFDTDGIVVRFMNSDVQGNGIHSEPEAAALVQQIRFSGTTPLGTSLDRKVLQPMVLSQARSNSMQKPVLVIAITDGEPTGEPKETVRNVIINAKNQLSNTPYGAGAVAFQFAQVGKDAAATRFLGALDTDPVCGNMIDCTSYFEQEQEQYARKGINLEPSLYLAKLMLGGIDRSYDEADEG